MLANDQAEQLHSGEAAQQDASTAPSAIVCAVPLAIGVK